MSTSQEKELAPCCLQLMSEIHKQILVCLMSKKQTIVKNLNSIQNFGAMDILCTDKTGTLTQNDVVLEYHLNIHGEDDLHVLRSAYLNSYFQTGYKNLMDAAIIKKTEALQKR